MTLPRRIIPSTRLRDQVYQILRQDIQNGTFSAGQRLIEVELATQYGVSRTPVREALFQLAREGLLEDSDRGYSLPVDTHDDFLDRISVRLALDPILAAHAALRGADAHKHQLARQHTLMSQAHADGTHTTFSEAAHRFRIIQIEMSLNATLIKVCRVLEDQFLISRSKQYRDKENREIALDFDGRLLKAITESDDKVAADVATKYMLTLINKYSSESASQDGAPWVALHDAT